MDHIVPDVRIVIGSGIDRPNTNACCGHLIQQSFDQSLRTYDVRRMRVHFLVTLLLQSSLFGSTSCDRLGIADVNNYSASPTLVIGLYRCHDCESLLIVSTYRCCGTKLMEKNMKVGAAIGAWSILCYNLSREEVLQNNDRAWNGLNDLMNDSGVLVDRRLRFVLFINEENNRSLSRISPCRGPFFECSSNRNDLVDFIR